MEEAARFVEFLKRAYGVRRVSVRSPAPRENRVEEQDRTPLVVQWQ
jgi:hypothetical protein